MGQGTINAQPNDKLNRKLVESSRPVIIRKNNLAIIGETHIKLSRDEETDQTFAQDLDRARIIIVEQDSLHNNGYSQSSPEIRFMQQAQENATENQKALVILDSEITDRYKLWLDAGIDVSREDLYMLVGMYSLLSDFQNQTPPSVSIQKLTQMYLHFSGNQTEYSDQMAQATYVALYGQSELDRIPEKTSLLLDFVKIDSVARERYYQTRIAQIAQAYPEEPLIVVVGKDHAQPISATLTDGSISEVDATLSTKINTTLSAIKERINFSNIVQ